MGLAMLTGWGNRMLYFSASDLDTADFCEYKFFLQRARKEIGETTVAMNEGTIRHREIDQELDSKPSISLADGVNMSESSTTKDGQSLTPIRVRRTRLGLTVGC